MAECNCRRCRRAADDGPYCGTCAADIMAKALNPLYRVRRKKSPRPELPQPSNRSPQLPSVVYWILTAPVWLPSHCADRRFWLKVGLHAD